MIDFGFGYGFWFDILRKNNCLPSISIGIDQDKALCEYAVEHIKEINTVVGDISKLNFPTGHFELAVCNQAIEHTSDDESVVENVYKSLKAKGVLYISSIIRQSLAWYIYKRNGEYRLSPMHVKEYKNLDEFVSLLTRHKFKILQARDKQYWLKAWSVPLLRGKIGVPIPGFRTCEALCLKP